MNTPKRALIGTMALATATVLISQVPRLVPESSPVERGAASARALGCIDCHGKPGVAIPDDSTLSCTDAGATIDHPRYEGSCGDLLAYFEAVRLKRTFKTRAASSSQNRLLQGEVLARQYNCFQCHGELGQGGFQNAGALKGYIPGYFGSDFAMLTRDGSAESVRSWVSRGIDPDLVSTPIKGAIARYFIARQAVSMPVFASLPDSTIRILADYVIALHRLGPMDAASIRAYGRETQKSRPAGSVALLSDGESVFER